MTGILTVVTTRDELAATSRPAGETSLVMTMGALHAGHARLISTARERGAGAVIVTIFVNPLQFGPDEDFSRYPRTLDADLEVCAAGGADIVFAPSAEQVYRGSGEVSVHPGPLGDVLEGTIRPGHFCGVLTVVHKLLHIVGDVDRAHFGEKDYQQLILITAMARDLDLPTAIVGCPTVRETDGLALSSRNQYLGATDRRSARALSQALFAGAAAAADGAAAAGVLAAAQGVLDGSRDVSVDYLELRSPELGPAPVSGAARLLVAARVGPTRLIDNVAVALQGQR